jgi:hypothetical protein
MSTLLTLADDFRTIGWVNEYPLPKLIHEEKAAIEPGIYQEPQGSFEDFIVSSADCVDLAGFEPATPSLQMRCSTK